MTREDIINELRNRGYKAEAQNCVKNCVVFEGVRIENGSNIAPVIYTEGFLQNAEKENLSLETVVDAIEKVYESSKDFDFDFWEVFNDYFLASHLFVGLQKSSDEEIIKRPSELEGIENYIYVRCREEGDYSASFKMTKGLLKILNMSEEEVWWLAESNTKAETDVKSLGKLLFGEEYEDDGERCPFYVITNKSRIKGASAILNRKAIEEVARKYEVEKVVILPSSIHEMLIVPYTDEMSLDEFSAMVEAVNESQVAPEERLTNRAYIVTL